MATHEGHSGNKWADLGREKLGTVLNREKLSNTFSRENLGNVNVGKTERWASVLGGAALAALAFRGGNRKSAVGLAALAGLPLLWRGATGHCPVYQKLGIDRTQTAGAGTALASEHADLSLTPTDLHPIGQSF
jgi:hypothetical protein